LPVNITGKLQQIKQQVDYTTTQTALQSGGKWVQCMEYIEA